MSDLIGTLRAIVRDELRRVRCLEIAAVTTVYPRDSDSSKNNHQVNLRLLESGVELQRVPVATSRIGLSALPNEGDLMVVAFAQGDPNAAIALGCLYDDQSHPPVAQLHEVVYQPPDPLDSAVRRIHVELQSGSTLTLDDDKLKIALGDTSVVVNRDGDVVIQAKGKVSLAADGDIELDAKGSIKMSAQSQITVKGMTVSVEGQSQASFKGATVSIAGMTQFSPS
jgi:phage baseplate assembly protein gpV